MAYSYTPANADAANVASRLETQTNAITGTPTLTAPIVNVDFRAFLQSNADALLDCLGYRAHSEVQAGSDSRGANTFADATTAYGTWTVAVPVAKTYLLRVDLSCYMTVGADQVAFQVMVDGGAVAAQPDFAARFYFNSLSEHNRLSWLCPIAFASTGNKAIKLQWRVVNAAGTVTTNADDFRMFTLFG